MPNQIRYQHLFSPLKIGNLSIDNRIIAAATVTNLAGADGGVTDRLIDLYAARAAGNPGLVTVEMSAVAPTGRAWHYMLGIWDDWFILDFTKLVEMIHFYGPKCSLQIGHCGRQTTRAIVGGRPLAPSSLSQFPEDHPSYMLPRALSPGEIKEIIDDTSAAAYRAKQAGFDAVEIHAAHGYLFHQFLSPFGNIRNDDYGGNTVNRCRILIDVISQIKKKCGPDFCIFCKIDGNEHVAGGINVEEATKIAGHLENAGVDSILVSGGCGASLEWIIPTAHMPSAPNRAEARAINKQVGIPVGIVGKIDDFHLADSIIAKHEIDYIALARPLLSDPELLNKLKNGKEEDIRHCIFCNEKCNSIEDQYVIGCSLNPLLGQERVYKHRSEPPQSKRKIAIIGGGPAGLKAAKVAAERGHEVHLFEKKPCLGGQVNLVAKIPGKEPWSRIIDYYQRALAKLNVYVTCGQDPSIDTIRELAPEIVIIATGAVPDLNLIEVSDSTKVTSSFEAIANPEVLEDKVVVVGGQKLAVDTALFLASQGKRVTIVARGKNEADLARNTTRSFRPHVIKYLREHRVHTIFSASVTAIDHEHLTIEGASIEKRLPYKQAVLATYLKPVFPSYLSEIHNWGIRVYRIGDCVHPRSLATAICEGFTVGQMT